MSSLQILKSNVTYGKIKFGKSDKMKVELNCVKQDKRKSDR